MVVFPHWGKALIKRSVAYLTSSLGAQLVVTLLVVIVGVGLSGLLMVTMSMRSMFDELERRDGYESIYRVVSAIQIEFNSLQQFTSHWATGDDFFHHIASNRDQINKKFPSSALRRLNISAVAVLDEAGKVIFQQENSIIPGSRAKILGDASLYYSLINSKKSGGCGFIGVKDKLIQLCWSGIYFEGQKSHETLVFFRSFDYSSWSKIFTLTRETFEINKNFYFGDVENLKQWFLSGLPTYVDSNIFYRF